MFHKNFSHMHEYKQQKQQKAHIAIGTRFYLSNKYPHFPINARRETRKKLQRTIFQETSKLFATIVKLS